MKEYSVRPNKDVTEWMVKIEDVAPETSFDQKDEAIAHAEQMAKEKSPARLLIYNNKMEVEEERDFN
ncbi:DUF2188 domain-containing protein [Alkalicoccus daliensis]|uniref:DUF2188 domain-containing protein n=1 Tax=Alkalicoccus daliensis TaxID=745820 RepID=A0A1H0KNT1_9BACI|nr:DUF2188 domain-containing protein [Alkalicoccus daliensis]SDO57420.1 hypothetical protein SAMN04488053_1198 [Alkalicoccus daliensis]